MKKLFSFLSSTIKTCSGCKFLYSEGIGYANDQRSGTRLACALDKNDNLPHESNFGTPVSAVSSTLIACDDYSEGRHISLDVTGNEGPALFSTDPEQIDAIARHSKRPREGKPLSWGHANLQHLRTSP